MKITLMKIITVNLPDSYLKVLEEICRITDMSRSELLRQAIRSYLITEIKLTNNLKNVCKRKREIEFFNYCINCERKLHETSRQNHFFHKDIEVFELKFCCSCFEQFKDKTFEEFPADLIEKIYRKIKDYKKERLKDI
jgi:Arc/MetJ-type ribon-helix-helix transcriptional regulator